MRGRAQVEAGGKLASTRISTCVHTCAVAERWRSGSKNRSARNGSNTQFAASASKPRAPNHHCPQEMADPPTSAPRPLRLCVNIPAVAEREFQNPPALAPQPPSACVNVALERIYSHFENRASSRSQQSQKAPITSEGEDMHTTTGGLRMEAFSDRSSRAENAPHLRLILTSWKLCNNHICISGEYGKVSLWGHCQILYDIQSQITPPVSECPPTNVALDGEDMYTKRFTRVLITEVFSGIVTRTDNTVSE